MKINSHWLWLIVIALAILVLSHFFLSSTVQGSQNFPDRGRYIYDDFQRLPIESEAALSMYLQQMDTKTDYEIIIVLPEEKYDDTQIIKWFNEHGVGKSGLDTGTAIFVFPDNSWFVSIGSGNDRISVPYAKTQGDKILKDLDEDLSLSLLRYVGSLNKELSDSTPAREQGIAFGKKVFNNLDILLWWVLVISLIAFLIQQFDGFQIHDLYIPIAIFICLGVFLLACAGSMNANLSYQEYGLINSTSLSTYEYSEVHCVSTGESTSCYTDYHTEYRNDVTVKSYKLEEYNWRFVTTDYKGAWEYKDGDAVSITFSEEGSVRNMQRPNDNSGGITIGDGVWG